MVPHYNLVFSSHNFKTYFDEAILIHKQRAVTYHTVGQDVGIQLLQRWAKVGL